MPIPAFDHNLVLPAHVGDPTKRADLSPYPCTTYELCERFATSPQRQEILKGLLRFREELRQRGLVNGFQWMDGSFLEDVETKLGRGPNDLDLVTIYWGYPLDFQNQLAGEFPAFADSQLSKDQYRLDHYPFDAGYSPAFTVENSQYWIQLFSHNRDQVWKGMLEIRLNTPDIDQQALDYLHSVNLGI
jgi:hypothetical protein